MLRVPFRFALSRSGKFGQEQFCRGCPAGWKRGEDDQLTECKQCEQGTNSQNISMSCISCNEGQYGSKPGVCTGCKFGQYTDSKKQIKCE
tara:strand:- start:613 stop:882 length:270 start_codon:yes stop_codon:yes gene_type:complete